MIKLVTNNRSQIIIGMKSRIQVCLGVTFNAIFAKQYIKFTTPAFTYECVRVC